MGIKTTLAGFFVAGTLVLGSPAAIAGLVCTGCEYGDQGTYLGAYNPDTFDFGTFQHSDIGLESGPHAAFVDFWVFDLAPGGSGSMSADFTLLTGITGFTGELYVDGGSVCTGSGCSSVVLGALVDSSASQDGARRWEIIAASLPAGRYVIQVTGTTNGNLTSAYTGQLAFIAEPGTLALLGLGLLGMAVSRFRSRS